MAKMRLMRVELTFSEPVTLSRLGGDCDYSLKKLNILIISMNSFISVDYYPVIMAFIAVAKLVSRYARFLRKQKNVTFRR
jgi:hypothetical protein